MVLLCSAVGLVTQNKASRTTANTNASNINWIQCSITCSGLRMEIGHKSLYQMSELENSCHLNTEQFVLKKNPA